VRLDVLRFGIIAEGPTDQVVLQSLLLGFFRGRTEDAAIRFIQPPWPLTENPAGWGHVFQSLKRDDCQNALQFNDYVVIHIDTDRQEDPGFDVPRRQAGVERTVEQRVDDVIERLKRDLEPDFLSANHDRILFAIAVECTECWLLPLLYDSENKASKTMGCLDAANEALRKKNNPGLSAGGKKFHRTYEKVSKDYRKRETLLKLGPRNPSLERFLTELARVPGPVEPSESAPDDTVGTG